jgi:hypothetical protein
MSDGGKGSAPRPLSVDQETFGSNWDRIFSKKREREISSEVEQCPYKAEVTGSTPVSPTKQEENTND